MKAHFSLRDLFVIVFAIAAGFSLSDSPEDSFWLDTQFVDFCLGMLSTFIGVGLAQQVYTDLRRDPGRSLALLFILAGIGFAIYRLNVPYSLSERELKIMDGLGYGSGEEMMSWNGRLALTFCLLLGSLTAPGLAYQATTENVDSRHFAVSTTISGGVLAAYCLIVFYTAISQALLWTIVDIAITGMMASIPTPAWIGDQNYVAWFGRLPSEFDEFVNWQVYTWPFLLISLIIVVTRSQRGARLRRSDVVLVYAAIGLALPALANVFRLENGWAAEIFPAFSSQIFWHPFILRELPLVLAVLFFISLYLSTRRSRSTSKIIGGVDDYLYWTDRTVVGWLFIAIGLYCIFNSFDSPFSYSIIDLIEDPFYFFQSITRLIVGDAYESYLCLLLPFGIYWLVKRRGSNNNEPKVRWPTLGKHHALFIPLTFSLLTLLVLLVMPFGMAAVHWLARW